MDDRRPARGVAAVAAAVVVAAVLAGGCAAIPSSGNPQSAAIPQPAGGANPQGFGLTLQPPQPGWPATQVVSNFLLASSIATDNYHLAREYLTAQASRSWHPGTGVTILSGTPVVSPVGHGLNVPPGGERQVGASGQELATLTSSGQYIAQSGANVQLAFTLEPQANGAYKIASLPVAGPGTGSGLLLTSGIFREVYTPRNLYYYAQRNGSLLPDPIFVPVQGASPVSTLVNDLSRDPAGGAAMTSFPRRTHLAGVQVFNGPSGGRTAIVNIAVPHSASEAPIAKMAIQLVCTLTSPVFGQPPLFHAVRIKINGRLWDARGPALTFRTYQNNIPHWRSGTNVYFLTQNGGVRIVGPGSDRSTALRGASAGQPPLTQVAVSPDGKQLAGIGALPGKVYTGTLIPSTKPGEPPSAGQLHARLTGSFTALSYDGTGDLWIAGRINGRRGIWVLPSGQREPLPVRPPKSVHGPVTGLRVAPDGVRVAMIIGRGAKAQLWLAAAKHNLSGRDFSITRPVPLGGQGVTGVLTDVSALTWYDENLLLAVAGPPNATHLWEVPVDGESPRSLLTGAFKSVTAAGPGNPFYLGFANGKLERAVGLNGFLQSITAGHAPAYPG